MALFCLFVIWRYFFFALAFFCLTKNDIRTQQLNASVNIIRYPPPLAAPVAGPTCSFAHLANDTMLSSPLADSPSWQNEQKTNRTKRIRIQTRVRIRTKNTNTNQCEGWMRRIREQIRIRIRITPTPSGAECKPRVIRTYQYNKAKKKLKTVGKKSIT